MPVFGFGYVRLRQQYSDEQNRVAVEHHLNHDRCLAGTIMGTRMSEPSVSAGGLRRTAGGGPISLQHERISELCGQP